MGSRPAFVSPRASRRRPQRLLDGDGRREGESRLDDDAAGRCGIIARVLRRVNVAQCETQLLCKRDRFQATYHDLPRSGARA
jgi:hypothetical protein